MPARTMIPPGSIDIPSRPTMDDGLDHANRNSSENARPSRLRPFDSSAIDLAETGSVTSLELPHGVLTSERVRRRSELSRVRPLDSPPAAITPESIELPVIAEHGKENTSTSGGGWRAAPDVSFNLKDPLDEEGVIVTSKSAVDVEIQPSFPSSLAPSVRMEDETASTVTLSPAQKAVHRRKVAVNFATVCFAIFLNGWNDGTTGPLLPVFQTYYHIGFTIVSMVFVASTVGFVTGALLNVYLTDKLGFGKCMVLGAICQSASYAMLAPAGPFPLMCIAFMFAGFGIALQNAHANGFVASSRVNAPTKLGFLHATYGLGALIAPLVSTQFAQQKHWSYHYLISAVLSVVNVALLIFVFRGRRQEDIKAEAGDWAPGQDSGHPSNKYKQIIGIREVHFLTLFSLIYIGTEVTIGGWSVTYIQQIRKGNSNTGYISSGFFGGLMLGRVLLMWLNQKIGERLALFLYAFLAIGLEVTVWVVPSLIENAVAVSFVGLLLGPMYPILMNHTSRILPRWLLTGSMSFITGIGMSGSAVLPFVTGLLSSRFGIASLQPFIVSMMSTLIVVWAIIPRVRHVPT